MTWLENERNRALLYRLCLALIPLLVVLDVITGELGDAVIRAVEVVLGIGVSGLATRNTTRKTA